jgi:hypothetical protein
MPRDEYSTIVIAGLDVNFGRLREVAWSVFTLCWLRRVSEHRQIVQQVLREISGLCDSLIRSAGLTTTLVIH